MSRPLAGLLSFAALDPTRLFVKAIKAVLSLLLGLILLTLLVGIVAIGAELQHVATDSVDHVLQRVLIGILMLLAVVEVFRTTLAYLTEGRVKVTFIVDTILVVMLTEVIVLWLKGGAWQPFLVLLTVIMALGGVRILAIRFSPTPVGREGRS